MKTTKESYFHRHEIAMRPSVEAFIQSGSIIVFNYFPNGWTECDAIEVTRSGFCFEYEMKSSRVGFENDRRKLVKSRKLEHGASFNVLGDKWDFLKNGHKNGPAKFWYVVPVGMVSNREVPKWAGLIYIDKNGKAVISREAPWLHRNRESLISKEQAKFKKFYCRR